MNIPQSYASREELYKAGLHNSYQKGIGKAKDGSGNMSIVLSGGYVDDEDLGDTIIYTGEGGRDPKTGTQTSDQLIKGGNKDLVEAFESGTPVYVTRGSSHKGEYSPKAGYSFAGKFLITEQWIDEGRDGFNVIRFKLVSEDKPIDSPKSDVENETERVEYTATRIVRETKLAKQIKEMYDYRCQVCGEQINLPTGNKYAEGAHIRPLGRPHNGPDVIENLLCLCPNHHLMFDKYCYTINPTTLELEGLDGSLHVINDHDVNRDHIKYHYDNYIAHS